MGTNNLTLRVFPDAAAASAEGFFYRAPEYKPLSLDTAVLVKDGTASGKPTVDLVLTDPNGQKYVAMITLALLSTVVTAGSSTG